MVKLLNRAYVETTTVGTGAISLGPKVVGYQSFVEAGAVDGDELYYVIEEGTSWEVGVGTYSSGSLTRSVLSSSNGGSLVSLTGSAKVFSSVVAESVIRLSNDDGNIIVEGADGGIYVPAPQLASENW